MFFSEFCEISKNIISTEHLQMTASELSDFQSTDKNVAGVASSRCSSISVFGKLPKMNLQRSQLLVKIQP